MAFIRRIKCDNPSDIQLDKKHLNFGRDDDNDVSIDKYGGISRNHCGFTKYEDGIITLTDFGSRNGTFINDEKIFEETPLKHGDKIIICEELQFEYFDYDSVDGKKALAEEKDQARKDEERKKRAIVVKGDEKMSDAMSEINAELANEDKDFKSMMDDILKPTNKKKSAPPPKILEKELEDPEKWVNEYEEVRIKRR